MAPVEQPTSLQEAINEVMAEAGQPMSAPDVHRAIEEKWPGRWPYISWLDIHDEMTSLYGAPTNG